MDERLDAAIAASQADAASNNIVPRPETTVRRSATKPVARAALPEKAPSIEDERPAPQPMMAPVGSPVVPISSAPAAVAQGAPAAPPHQERSTDPALLWALGGGALIMLGMGGAAMMRRRNHPEDEELLTEEATYLPPARTRVDPAAVPSMVQPAPITTPAEESRLQAKVAAPPSPENPFRTYAKRMTRAKFLLARKNAQSGAPAGAPETARPVLAQPVSQPKQTVYRFGSERGRKELFSPRTS